ncbi:PIG-L deacetylase family protein [Rhodocista pekingensis]|uniref:PIG-L deacetylase family protein n=1 Tax=Rhodocista pekingensis TaxID=201185 RepID=A0ABW2KUY5_9PROT
MLTLSLGPGTPLDILCLGAHSDDVEIGCGGTLLTLLERHPGSSVHWVVFAADDVRASEARDSAADFLRAAGRSRIDVHAFRDGFFPAQFAEIKQCFEALKRCGQPDLVLTHHREDRHQDHRTLADLAWNTFRNHLILEYEIPKYDGDTGNPNLYVPLTRAAAERKAGLLMQHFGSQRARSWFTPETFLGLMRLRGIQSAAPEGYAEGFHAHKVCL